MTLILIILQKYIKRKILDIPYFFQNILNKILQYVSTKSVTFIFVILN